MAPWLFSGTHKVLSLTPHDSFRNWKQYCTPVIPVFLWGFGKKKGDPQKFTSQLNCHVQPWTAEERPLFPENRWLGPTPLVFCKFYTYPEACADFYSHRPTCTGAHIDTQTHIKTHFVEFWKKYLNNTEKYRKHKVIVLWTNTNSVFYSLVLRIL